MSGSSGFANASPISRPPFHARFHHALSILPIAANIAPPSGRPQGFLQQALPVPGSAPTRQESPHRPFQNSNLIGSRRATPRNANRTRKVAARVLGAGFPSNQFHWPASTQAPFQPTIEPRANNVPAPLDVPLLHCRPRAQFLMHPHSAHPSYTRYSIPAAARPLPYHPTGFRLKSRKIVVNKGKSPIQSSRARWHCSLVHNFSGYRVPLHAHRQGNVISLTISRWY